MFNKTHISFVKSSIEKNRLIWVEFYPLADKSFWDILNCNWKEWVDRFSEWWLTKRKRIEYHQEYVNKKMKFESIEINQGQIIDQCLEQINEIHCRYGWSTKPELILIGTKQIPRMQELAEKGMINEIIKFQLNTQQIYSPVNGLQKITNCMVCIVPWMDGILALPSIDKLIIGQSLAISRAEKTGSWNIDQSI